MTQMTRIGSTGINEFFNDLSSPSLLLRPFFNKLMADDIPVEVKEDAQSYTVEAEIPGVRKEDIKINLDGNFLTLSAQIKRTSETAANERVFCSERFYGSVSRGLQLPANVDASKCTANYKDGLLTLVLQKVSNGSGKTIAIN
jgi:HSP20 family protein